MKITPNDPKSVGQRIRNIRQILGDSMEQFAKKIDDKAKSGTVSNWETGKNLPNSKRLKTIAELGNISVDYLLEGKVSVKEIRPLSDLVKGLDEEASRPLEANEFMAIYKDEVNNEISYRDTVKNKMEFFDLNRIINTEYQVNTKYETGISALGNSPLYYSGKKLTYKDREKISRILDAVFDIDRNSQE